MFPGTLAYIQSSCRIQTSAFALERQPREHISQNANPTQNLKKKIIIKEHAIKTVKSHWYSQSRG